MAGNGGFENSATSTGQPFSAVSAIFPPILHFPAILRSAINFIICCISYISSNKPEQNNIFINNSIEEKESKYNCNINNKNRYNIGKLQTGNNSIKNLNLNNINNQLKKSFNSYQFNQKDIYFSKQTEPMELYKLLNNSISHILTKKPFFSKVNKKLLKKMEYEYIKQDLAKNGVNINDLFKGCLDCLSDLL